MHLLPLPFPPVGMLTRLHQWIAGRSPLFLILLVSLLLTGCVQSNVEIQFDSPNQGKIVQHLQIADQLRTLGTTTQQWLDAIDQRSHSLGGETRRLSEQSLEVVIPFSSHKDLERKFNQFLKIASADDSAIAADLPALPSHLTVTRSNFFLVERNRLRYDLDLRSLGVLSSSGSLLFSPGALIDLEFRLTTPWGARSVPSAKPAFQQGHQLGWKLVPGELNHLEAVFWLPSPLGIGTLVIILFAIAGFYLRYPQRQKSPVL